MIRFGMGKKWSWLAGIYAFFGVVAAFGVGNGTQINTAIVGINSAISAYGGSETRIGNLFLGFVFALIIGLILLGGAKRIGVFAETLVPIASAAYILLGIGILLVRFDAIPYVDESFANLKN
jgi:AGCS family alanine or glycine:cation symporter